jgi:hypothetical protein
MAAERQDALRGWTQGDVQQDDGDEDIRRRRRQWRLNRSLRRRHASKTRFAAPHGVLTRA